MATFIPARGRILYVAAVCLNRIGKHVSKLFARPSVLTIIESFGLIRITVYTLDNSNCCEPRSGFSKYSPRCPARRGAFQLASVGPSIRG
jgi:hypothetical protein